MFKSICKNDDLNDEIIKELKEEKKENKNSLEKYIQDFYEFYEQFPNLFGDEENKEFEEIIKEYSDLKEIDFYENRIEILNLFIADFLKKIILVKEYETYKSLIMNMIIISTLIPIRFINMRNSLEVLSIDQLLIFFQILFSTNYDEDDYFFIFLKEMITGFIFN
jgi:hypothetical protein